MEHDTGRARTCRFSFMPRTIGKASPVARHPLTTGARRARVFSMKIALAQTRGTPDAGADTCQAAQIVNRRVSQPLGVGWGLCGCEPVLWDG